MSFRTFPFAAPAATAFILLVLIASARPVSAQAIADTTALRLDDLLREVRTANPSLRAQRLRVDALNTQPEQAAALPDPTVGGAYQPYSIVTARGPQRSQWQIQQQIPFPGKRHLRGEVARLTADVAASEAEAFAEDLAYQVKTAYYTLYRVQEQTRLIRQFQEDLAGFEESAATQYEVGRGPQQAILKAQVERGRLEVRIEQLEEARAAAQQTLARLLDRPDLDAAVRPVRWAPPDVAAAPDWVEVALQERPEAEALRRTRQRADRQQALARRSLWPDLTVGLRYIDIQPADLGPTMTGRDALVLSFGVNVPLWRDKQRAQVEEAKLEARRAETQLEALRLEIQTRLKTLRQQLQRQQRQLALLQDRLIPQAQTALEASLSSYSTGQTDFLDVLDAERTLFQLQMDYEATYARYLTTMAAVERTLGVTALDAIQP